MARLIQGWVCLAVMLGGVACGGETGSHGAPQGGAPQQGLPQGGSPQDGDAANCPIDVAGAFGRGGIGGASGAGTANVAAAGTTHWDVDVWIGSSSTLSEPSTSLSMRLSPEAGKMRVEMSNAGGFQTALVEPLLIGADSGAQLTIPLGARERISLQSFVWRGLDQDADGTLDAIEGVGTSQEPSIYTTPQYSVELKARPDATAPAVLVPPMMLPVGERFLTASEQLQADAVATLTSGDTTLTLPVDQTGIQFSIPWVLPLGSVWNVTFDGSDLSGHPLAQASDELRVIEDPGLFAQDGFEGPNLAVSGDSRVVGTGIPGPIAGEWSLAVDGSAMLHLARPSCRNHLRFSLQRLTNGEYGYEPSVWLDFGVVGGTSQQQTLLPFGQRSKVPGQSTDYYPPQEFDELLTEPGGDMVVRFVIGPSVTTDISRSVTLLIDDVRIE